MSLEALKGTLILIHPVDFRRKNREAYRSVAKIETLKIDRTDFSQ